mmetsp:Transcript_96078/g.299211  ORF Transcript_96078/g.299211 Transcript_96078/m.299211 type:complete len:304 (+) Transcript_96078:205-1116(+)
MGPHQGRDRGTLDLELLASPSCKQSLYRLEVICHGGKLQECGPLGLGPRGRLRQRRPAGRAGGAVHALRAPPSEAALAMEEMAAALQAHQGVVLVTLAHADDTHLAGRARLRRGLLAEDLSQRQLLQRLQRAFLGCHSKTLECRQGTWLQGWPHHGGGDERRDLLRPVGTVEQDGALLHDRLDQAFSVAAQEGDQVQDRGAPWYADVVASLAREPLLEHVGRAVRKQPHRHLTLACEHRNREGREAVVGSQVRRAQFPQEVLADVLVATTGSVVQCPRRASPVLREEAHDAERANGCSTIQGR